jgi:hypothetical protein
MAAQSTITMTPTMALHFFMRVARPNGKLTDDEERAQGARLETKM